MHPTFSLETVCAAKNEWHPVGNCPTSQNIYIFSGIFQTHPFLALIIIPVGKV